MSNLVGIDLGTTYSSIAKLDDTGRPIIIDNAEGKNVTPSIVSFESDNSVVVGEVAMQNFGIDKNTFGRFKREMGTDKEYVAFDKKYNPTSLSSFVLKKLKDDAELSIGEISEAVVTIPANFANEAREATLAAAKTSGLSIKNIINEPTAAALYYAFASGDELNGNYAIYDLGGGTFDISLIKVEGTEIEVINSDGVSKLGGDDFDEKLIRIVRDKYKKEAKEELDAEDFTKNQAEEHKKILSTRSSTKIRISSKRKTIEVTREEYENAISTLIAESEITCENAVEEANLSMDDINEVILVGGSTRIPAVKASVEKVFKKTPKTVGNPDEAVSLGAALFVAYKADPSKLTPLQQRAVSKVNLSDVTTKFFGTSVAEYDPDKKTYVSVNDTLIEKMQKLPCSVTKEYVTLRDGQASVKCDVNESNVEETELDFVKKIWEGELELPPGRPAGQKIEVTFAYDENQTMKCSFVDVATKNEKVAELVLDNENVQTDIDIEDFKVD
ncbi:MAG: hypothetical protein CMD89_05245 [Gammaproteobacteria bacterium]|nr:hypothetical protein [Gammaproteobacteria bacterium]|tara:strand:- start:4030 stop:5532 length:1503 start_codon:yes stop_codon:yes gene_type:complete